MWDGSCELWLKPEIFGVFWSDKKLKGKNPRQKVIIKINRHSIYVDHLTSQFLRVTHWVFFYRVLHKSIYDWEEGCCRLSRIGWEVCDEQIMTMIRPICWINQHQQLPQSTRLRQSASWIIHTTFWEKNQLFYTQKKIY